MNERLSMDGRMALIADALGEPLDACEAEELALLAEVLADPSTWEQPRPELEDLVVEKVLAVDDNVASLPVVSTARAKRRMGRYLAATAAVAAAALVFVGVVGGGSPGNDFSATMQGTALAPGAHASAAFRRTNSGFRIALDAAHLPRLDAHHYYEGWLKGSEGDLVPVGTFSSSDGRVTLWAGVSPAHYQALTVTIERDDNDQNSSGRVVLRGLIQAH
jgi:hypothetical protein